MWRIPKTYARFLSGPNKAKSHGSAWVRHRATHNHGWTRRPACYHGHRCKPVRRDPADFLSSTPFPEHGKCGRLRRRPSFIVADRGYDSNRHRKELVERGMRLLIARCNTVQGFGIGIFQWYVEPTIAWLQIFNSSTGRFMHVQAL